MRGTLKKVRTKYVVITFCIFVQYLFVNFVVYLWFINL